MYQNIPQRQFPTLLIILIDQSILTSRLIEKVSIADRITDDLNLFLNELCIPLYRGSRIYPVIDLNVIGYGLEKNDCSILLSCNIEDLPNKQVSVQHITKRVSDGYGGYINIDYDLPNYIVPNSVWIPNEDKAFDIAKDLIVKYTANRTSEYDCVPIVINLTSGNCPRASQKRVVDISEDIKNIKMFDGYPLIINIPYLTEKSSINNEKYNYLIESSSLDTIKEMLSNDNISFARNNNPDSQNSLYISNVEELISFVNEFYNYFDGDYGRYNNFLIR